jgi:hypothetical protein
LQNKNKFRELLGDDIMFFNKVETKPEHREQALEHEDTCTCDVCKIKRMRLKVRRDKKDSG